MKYPSLQRLIAIFLRSPLAIATATAISLLTSCTSIPTPNTTTETVNQHHEQMNHGDMQHGMNHNLDLGPDDTSYDLRFIDAMIPHHEGAIIMAKEAQQKSQRPEIQKLAQEIIAVQNQEISSLKKWRQSWYPQAPKAPQTWNSQTQQMMAMSPEQIAAMGMNLDLGTADAKFDLRFINAMIPHHEGAVIMAKDALKKSKRPEIQKLAQEIISSQETEIKQMQQWGQNWYKK